jgi:hypothetical protein
MKFIASTTELSSVLENCVIRSTKKSKNSLCDLIKKNIRLSVEKENNLPNI